MHLLRFIDGRPERIGKTRRVGSVLTWYEFTIHLSTVGKRGGLSPKLIESQIAVLGGDEITVRVWLDAAGVIREIEIHGATREGAAVAPTIDITLSGFGAVAEPFSPPDAEVVRNAGVVVQTTTPR